MDFTIPDTLKQTLSQIREFIRAEILPLERDLLTRAFGVNLPLLQEKRARVKSLGWWSPPIPREFGGMGLPLDAFAHVSEELGRTPYGHFIFNCAAPDIGNMEVLIQHATREQKEKYLLPLVRGEIRSCFSMTEPEFPGSNPVWMATTARKEASDFVINGHKWYTTSAEGAAFAVVMALTDPENPKPHRRASQIIVPLDAPGLKLRNMNVMGHAGDGWASHGEIVYENVRVPQTNLLGKAGAGFVIAQDRLGPGRIHHCMRWIGICERTFELMCAHAAKRQMSPGQPLAHKQIVQAWIAESRAEIDAARLMVLNAAWKMEREGARAARIEISTIKFFVANVLDRVLDRAIQAHGGWGLTDDTPLAFWYRSERAARIYDGADEVHKAVIARQVMKGYGVEIN